MKSLTCYIYTKVNQHKKRAMNKDISIFDDHQALWESWYPLREESEEWIRICALTPIGEVRIIKYHLGVLWDVYPNWEAHKDSGVSEQEAIEKAIESYVRSLKRVTREYIKGLRVHLGRMKSESDLWTPTSTYSIRKGVRKLPDGNLEPTYVLFCEGVSYGTSPDFHVWEDYVTNDYRWEIEEALLLNE